MRENKALLKSRLDLRGWIKNPWTKEIDLFHIERSCLDREQNFVRTLTDFIMGKKEGRTNKFLISVQFLQRDWRP